MQNSPRLQEFSKNHIYFTCFFACSAFQKLRWNTVLEINPLWCHRRHRQFSRVSDNPKDTRGKRPYGMLQNHMAEEFRLSLMWGCSTLFWWASNITGGFINLGFLLSPFCLSFSEHLRFPTSFGWTAKLKLWIIRQTQRGRNKEPNVPTPVGSITHPALLISLQLTLLSFPPNVMKRSSFLFRYRNL